MYSSRRRYYRRKFNRNLFSPSYRTGLPPTYTQMKGRVIRTTPLYDNPNIFPPVMSKQILDQMKKILEDAHYLPTVQSLSKYTTMGVTTLNLSAFSESTTYFNNESLDTLVHQTFTLPSPPTNSHWVYSLMGLTFRRDANTSTDGTLFSLSWDSPLLVLSLMTLVEKANDIVSYNGPYSHPVFATAGSQHNYANVDTITFQQYNIVSNQELVTTTDDNPNDNETYPLITTDPTVETYGSELLFDKSNSSLQSLYHFDFYLLCYLLPN